VIPLIIAADVLAAVLLTVATGVVIIRNGGEAEHQGADAGYADQLAEVRRAAAEVPADLALPGPYRLAADWPEQLDPPTVPELGEPALVRPYVYGRHHEDTIEIVPADYRPSIGARRIAQLVDTQQIPAVQA
jgi:hypothetical protein